MKKKIVPTVELFLTAMIWGLAFVAQRQGADLVDPFTFNGTRFVLGGLVLVPVIFLFERRRPEKAVWRRTLWSGAVVGAILFTASWLQQWGIQLTGSASKAGFITGTYTVLVPVCAFLFLRRKTGLLTWIGAVLAVIGLFLLSVGDDFTVSPGDLVLLLGAFFWAAHILVVDRLIGRCAPLRFSMVQDLTCGALSLLCALLFEEIRLPAIGAAATPILYCGIMSVGVAYTLQILAQRDADPTFAAIVFSTESVWSAIGSAILLREFLTGRGYAGCALIFCGIILSQIRLRGRKKAA